MCYSKKIGNCAGCGDFSRSTLEEYYYSKGQGDDGRGLGIWRSYINNK